MAPLLALAAGLVLQDCVLLASAALLGFRAFHGGMDGAAPMAHWRVVVRCWAAGWLALAISALLLIEVASVMAGWWVHANRQPWLAFVSLTAAVVLAGVLDPGKGSVRGPGPLAAGLALASLAWAAHGEGLDIAPCLFAIATALVVGAGGWHLARASTESLHDTERLR